MNYLIEHIPTIVTIAAIAGSWATQRAEIAALRRDVERLWKHIDRLTIRES